MRDAFVFALYRPKIWRSPLLSRAHQFLFIHVPKTGGNAIHNALLPFSEDEKKITQKHDGVQRFELSSTLPNIRKHSGMSDYVAHLDQDTLGGLFKFAVTRDPWDRCVSHYFSPNRGNVIWKRSKFETFICDTVLPMEHYLRHSPDDLTPEKNCDFFLRFENIADDFAKLLEALGVPADQLEKVNVSKRRHYAYYYDEKLRNLVAEKFRWEINQFNYRYDHAETPRKTPDLGVYVDALKSAISRRFR